MDEFDIPIFKKSYELYKIFYSYRPGVPKQDRYTICQRVDNSILDIIETILLAAQKPGGEKLALLEQASARLSLLRVLIRLMKEIRTIDNKKYVALQGAVDEIGRMLGGWIKATRERA